MPDSGAVDELDRTLSLAMRGLQLARTPRATLERVAALGFGFVTLDAAAPGLRPRELSRADRRDLAALLRRLELGVGGVELWIPPAHFADAATVDRAVEAVCQALQLLADLRPHVETRSVLSLALPRAPGQSVVETLTDRAAQLEARLADFGDLVDADDEAHNAGPSLADEVWGVGLDPAALLLQGSSPARRAAQLGARLAAARLSDADRSARVEPGKGELDAPAYRAALSVAGLADPVSLDVRGLADQAAAALRARRLWRQAGGGLGLVVEPR